MGIMKLDRSCENLHELQTGFFGDCGCSEKASLEPVAAAKIDQITAQLKTSDGSSSTFDPVERMKDGFIYFKREKYEYVISL